MLTITLILVCRFAQDLTRVPRQSTLMGGKETESAHRCAMRAGLLKTPQGFVCHTALSMNMETLRREGA